ncbi:MAG: RNase adapter RapZ [Rhodospirillaceae bacterium]|jgi:RNase adapter protein RapZ|nr:RNase adapter RapZ [Rhodospirillaceae bacterium]MBT5374153.1 RNase adapter RapZ [Rhodospirillaceae bacterium]MBT5659969.1 RNase adapter RapZ [Rhodospirillaceae bacterium]MBT5751837.1 RNase adapter RapZ [Rhodospirillaceae bacterium]
MGTSDMAGSRDISTPLAGERIVLVTGLSGAGHSSALKGFEDLGYEAVDNLPISLLSAYVRQDSLLPRPLAIGIDIRTRDFEADRVLEEIAGLKSSLGVEVQLLFLDCDDDVLVRRFTETRRRHPLAADRPLADGIYLERRLLARLGECADVVMDTSLFTLGEFQHQLARHFRLDSHPGVAVTVLSFAFSKGLPREADLVFDVRFLKNPHYEVALREKTGRDRQVADFVTSDTGFAAFFDGLTGLLLPLLPRFEREGKSYLTIAIGCTGGRHRSVFVAEKLASWLREQEQRVSLLHRDCEPGG